MQDPYIMKAQGERDTLSAEVIGLKAKLETVAADMRTTIQEKIDKIEARLRAMKSDMKE